ncbi:selenoprotein Pb-like [Pomacea canaliculata]|uniref:selenoprotein Pb-like n=1 Tax=Pomacea canaliculata TaxID=400727 RepID=UPI000D72B5C2|nr:selenoprotein Pb-like [Pomacea canaliculata]
MLPPVLAVVGLLLAAAPLSVDGRMGRCHQAPRFTVNGVEPLQQTRGKVTVVALLISTCSFCLQQAERPQCGDVHYKWGVGGSPDNINNLVSRVSFPVYQDDSSEQIWNQVFRGRKDDILIFDRCGKLTYHLEFPAVYLGYNYVRTAIRRTLNRPICPACQDQSTDPHNSMMGDAPAANRFAPRQSRPRGHRNRNRNTNQNRNHSHCPRDDPLCTEIHQVTQQWHRLQRQNTLSHNFNEQEGLRIFTEEAGTQFPGMAPL